MSQGHQIALAAESYVGTPFKHKGRTPGVGLDCVGVVLCAAWSCGLVVPDFYDYGPMPMASRLLSELSSRGHMVPHTDMRAGNVMLFGPRKDAPAHFAIYDGEGRMIHAHEPTGKVVRHHLDRAWATRLHSCWRLTGVADG